MKTNSFVRFATFLVIAAALGIFTPAVFAAERLLVPKADSPTAMVRCGAELETVKKRLGAAQRYVFTGSERLTNMKYCVREAQTEVVDTRNEYRVPKGTVGWLAADGKVVLEGCVNEATCRGCAVPPPVAAVPPPPPAPPVPPVVIPEKRPLPSLVPKEMEPKGVAAVVSVTDDHTIRVRVWDKVSAKGETAALIAKMREEPGFQSRDLGKTLREAAVEGKIQPLKSCLPGFKIAFSNLHFDRARGKILHVNGQPMRMPDKFGKEANAFPVEVCNGDASISIPRDWIAPDTALVIYPPVRSPILFYPPSGRIRTVAAAAGKKTWCGKEDTRSASEFYKLAMNCGASNYHFVVNSDLLERDP